MTRTMQKYSHLGKKTLVREDKKWWHLTKLLLTHSFGVLLSHGSWLVLGQSDISHILYNEAHQIQTVTSSMQIPPRLKAL